MTRRHTTRPRALGRVEQAVMDYVWAHGAVTADACREGLTGAWPMKESTVRTVLRRLEEKGYVDHRVDGRTYVYRAVEAPLTVASRAVEQIIDRLCGGSAEALVVGLVANDVLSPRQLERLSQKIAQQKAKQGARHD